MIDNPNHFTIVFRLSFDRYMNDILIYLSWSDFKPINENQSVKSLKVVEVSEEKVMRMAYKASLIKK